MRYECDKCGACCKGTLIVEAEELDVLREPRIIDADSHHRGKSVEQMVHEIQTEWKAVILACSRPCMFLGEDNLCQIYPTRPNACVGMQAGDEQCQDARAANGLPPLLPIDEAPCRS
jgi:Fe-S-cluster containining protein